MVPYQLRAFLVCLLSGFWLIFYIFHLASVICWRRWALLQSCRILVSTWSQSAWPIVAVVTSIKRGVRRQDFSMGEVSNVLTPSLSSTFLQSVDGEPISDCVLPAAPVLVVPEECCNMTFSSCLTGLSGGQIKICLSPRAVLGIGPVSLYLAAELTCGACLILLLHIG